MGYSLPGLMRIPGHWFLEVVGVLVVVLCCFGSRHGEYTPLGGGGSLDSIVQKDGYKPADQHFYTQQHVDNPVPLWIPSDDGVLLHVVGNNEANHEGQPDNGEIPRLAEIDQLETTRDNK